MFTERRLTKARHEAFRQIVRAVREMKLAVTTGTAATGFPHVEPATSGPAPDLIRALQEALDSGDIERIETKTKELKQLVDQHVPLWRTSIVREYADAIIVALVLALIIRTFVVQAFKIPSGSMIPTLRVGDHILVNKFIYGLPVPFMNKKFLSLHKPQRGDIIVFKFPGDQTKDYIKRVVGVPGDTIEVRGNSLFINGREAPKNLIGAYRYEDPRTYEQTGNLYQENIDGNKHQVLYDTQGLRLSDTVRKVPEGQYFCMGDNRDHSNDSRYWGFVPFDLIKGKAMIIYFSWPPGQFVRIGHLVQ